MSLSFTLPAEKEFTTRRPYAPNQTVRLQKIDIVKIVDIPERKAVLAIVKNVGKIKVANLSDGNYNNPPWTDQAIIDNLSAQLSA